MGYTYDDFVTAANKAGVMNRFSDNDLSTAKKNPEYGMSMVGLMQQIRCAKTTECITLETPHLIIPTPPAMAAPSMT